MHQKLRKFLLPKKPNPTLSLYICGYENCPPYNRSGPSIRSYYLFHYIKKGKGTYIVDDKQYELTGGQGFLIYPGKITYYISDTNDPWEYVWVGFHGSEAKEIVQNCGFSEDVLIFNGDGTQIYDGIMDLLQIEDIQSNQYLIRSIFYKIVNCIYLTNHTNLLHEDYFEQATSYIHANYGESIHISDIANHIGVDRTYLYKIFIKNIAKSPQKYLLHYRLDIACHLIKSSPYKIADIATSCGFQDLAAFYKYFKKKYGDTPLKYRINHMD